MQRPRLQLTSVTIGSSQPEELAQFYANLLDWEVAVSEPPPGWRTDRGLKQA